MESIIVSNVTKQYHNVKKKPFLALNNVSFNWNRGENLAIIGESGSGKSTLARLIIGLEKPNSGTILIDNENINTWNYTKWRNKRRHIQAVFQDSCGTMDSAFSVYHNLEEAMRNLTKLDRNKRKERIYKLMELTHISPKLLQVPVRQLSGGEQRRLSLLRAISIYPDYLILDELTSGLDLISANAVLSVLEKCHEEFGCSYLLITHDKQIAYRIADKILEMQKGEIVQVGYKKIIKKVAV